MASDTGAVYDDAQHPLTINKSSRYALTKGLWDNTEVLLSNREKVAA